jgi:hypothetical protein
MDLYVRSERERERERENEIATICELVSDGGLGRLRWW